MLGRCEAPSAPSRDPQTWRPAAVRCSKDRRYFSVRKRRNSALGKVRISRWRSWSPRKSQANTVEGKGDTCIDCHKLLHEKSMYSHLCIELFDILTVLFECIQCTHKNNYLFDLHRV